MSSFKNFLINKEAYQVGIDKEYQFSLENIFQAAKYFTIKNPEKMEKFLKHQADRDQDLKDNIYFSFLYRKEQKENPTKPLGDLVGFDVLKPSQSPEGGV